MYKKFLSVIVAVLMTFSVANAQANSNSKDDERDNNRSNSFFNFGLRIIGLTSDNKLVSFSEFNPRNTRNIGTISGFFGSDTALIGIDYRVQDGRLYGVGNRGGVYRINLSNASLEFVNSLTETLDGTSFGVDFNPAADRLRIISNTGQNLRHNVNLGGTTNNDGFLSYTSPATARALGVTGAAYTNNDLESQTVTTLYDIDSNLDQVSIQSLANNGTLAPTGKLTVDTTAVLGFDIYSTVREGVTVKNEGFAVLTLADGSRSLYKIVLTTGTATERGEFRSRDQVVDIAIPLNQR